MGICETRGILVWKSQNPVWVAWDSGNGGAVIKKALDSESIFSFLRI